MIRDLNNIRRIIIHCSDSPNDRDIGVREIKDWHLNRGFLDVGYHYVVRRNGEVENGRPLKRAGAHCEGYNSDSIGICLVGRDQFTEQQFNAIKAVLMSLKRVCPNVTEIKGHREYSTAKGKTCPNLTEEQMKDIRNSYAKEGS